MHAEGLKEKGLLRVRGAVLPHFRAWNGGFPRERLVAVEQKCLI